MKKIEQILFIDRLTGKLSPEKVYGGSFLRFLYGKNFFQKIMGKYLAALLACFPLFSRFVGWWQKQSWTKKKILPFINEHKIDAQEFLEEPSAFASFNDFFIRKLKPSARPICEKENVAVIPADGRYLFYPDIKEADGFVIKNKKFSIEKLLLDSRLAEIYDAGSMVIARLCPSDYHRFHFPCACIPGPSRLINGALWSVNPWALQHNFAIFTENKRVVTTLETDLFGPVIYIEVGAKAVGTIHQTYKPGSFCSKGAEKGYFSFGGSTLILLFKPNTIQFDADLITASTDHIEIKCLLGQSMGISLSDPCP